MFGVQHRVQTGFIISLLVAYIVKYGCFFLSLVTGFLVAS